MADGKYFSTTKKGERTCCCWVCGVGCSILRNPDSFWPGPTDACNCGAMRR